MNRKVISGSVLALSALMIAAGPDPMVWTVDVPHTGIEFGVKHFFTPVRGEFDDYEIELRFDREAPEHSSVRVRIDVASVNTGNDRRDEHLLSADFFEAEKYPYITFESTQVRQTAKDELLVRGPLRIKDHVQEIELPIKILGVMDVAPEMQEMLGGVTEIASFETALQIDRSEYGVGTGSWAAALVVGHEVDIGIAVEANR
jgi:polyisoprenoid-binding protein YceI